MSTHTFTEEIIPKEIAKRIEARKSRYSQRKILFIYTITLADNAAYTCITIADTAYIVVDFIFVHIR